MNRPEISLHCRMAGPDESLVDAGRDKYTVSDLGRGMLGLHEKLCLMSV